MLAPASKRSGRSGCIERVIDAARTCKHSEATAQDETSLGWSSGASRFDELFGPGDRLVILHREPTQPAGTHDSGRGCRGRLGRRPTETRCAGWPTQTGRTIRMPRAAGDCPIAHHDPGSRAAKCRAWAVRESSASPPADKLLLGELADRLQHREPGASRRPIRDEQRFAHQRIEQIQRPKSSSEPATAQALSRSNPPANTEHRPAAPFRHRRAGRRTTARRDAAFGGARGPRTRPAAGTVVEAVAHLIAVIDAIRDAANSIGQRNPVETTADLCDHLRRRQLKSPARHCEHARQRDPPLCPTSSERTRHTCSSATPKSFPAGREDSDRRRCPSTARSDRPPHREHVRSCRTPAAGSGLRAPAATDSAIVLPGCCVMPSTAATASGTAAGSADRRELEKPYTVGNSSAQLCWRLPVPAGSCRPRRRRSG